jgi:excinuclease ABC subunit C
MAKKNAAECASKYKEGAVRDEETLISLASLLSLEVVPERIEVYDISNIGNEYTTAGMIVYEDGRLRKNQYRTFRIKNAVKDDYGAMREVLRRRFSHLSDASFGAMPDLILLDGGRAHVGVGREVLKDLGLSIPLFGMVKDAFHKTRALSDEENEIGIAREQAVFVFLYKLQEEVHRHAVSATMGAKQKSLRHSTLENIPGIGKERARLLLAYFGNMRRIKEASADELSRVRGMTRPAAEAVFAHYHPTKQKKDGQA